MLTCSLIMLCSRLRYQHYYPIIEKMPMTSTMITTMITMIFVPNLRWKRSKFSVSGFHTLSPTTQRASLTFTLHYFFPLTKAVQMFSKRFSMSYTFPFSWFLCTETNGSHYTFLFARLSRLPDRMELSEVYLSLGFFQLLS